VDQVNCQTIPARRDAAVCVVLLYTDVQYAVTTFLSSDRLRRNLLLLAKHRLTPRTEWVTTSKSPKAVALAALAAARVHCRRMRTRTVPTSSHSINYSPVGAEEFLAHRLSRCGGAAARQSLSAAAARAAEDPAFHHIAKSIAPTFSQRGSEAALEGHDSRAVWSERRVGPHRGPLRSHLVMPLQKSLTISRVATAGVCCSPLMVFTRLVSGAQSQQPPSFDSPMWLVAKARFGWYPRGRSPASRVANRRRGL